MNSPGEATPSKLKRASAPSLVQLDSPFSSYLNPAMAHNFSPLSERPIKKTLVLFDVDGTLTPARKVNFILSGES